jgi:hypothetical protein
LNLVWDKPVIVFYRERFEEPERKALAVVKARKLIMTGEQGSYEGNIEGFFPLMGNIDSFSKGEGKSDRYVLCWFDDKEDDFSKSWRRLTGVTLTTETTFVTDEKGKRSYNAHFKAEKAKLE